MVPRVRRQGRWRWWHFSCNGPATAGICSLSLHDALPIYRGVDEPAREVVERLGDVHRGVVDGRDEPHLVAQALRSEEHTSELQSHHDFVCRLLLEKKK